MVSRDTSFSPSIDPRSVWVVIAAFNEEQVISGVLESLRPLGYNVLVVDDGSTDGTYERVESHRWVHLASHPFNLGQGAALQTGITGALSRGARFIVTFDADGQHDPDDIPKLLKPIIDGSAHVTLGSRFLDQSPGTLAKIPRLRRLLLKAATWQTRLMTGLPLTDTHNGLRGLTAHAASRLSIKQNRMAHASELLVQIAQMGVTVREVPVRINYSLYSNSKGQKSTNLFNILWDLFFGSIQ